MGDKQKDPLNDINIKNESDDSNDPELDDFIINEMSDSDENKVDPSNQNASINSKPKRRHSRRSTSDDFTRDDLDLLAAISGKRPLTEGDYIEANRNRKFRKLRKEADNESSDDKQIIPVQTEENFIEDDIVPQSNMDDYTLEIRGPTHSSEAMNLIASIFGDVSDFFRVESPEQIAEKAKEPLEAKDRPKKVGETPPVTDLPESLSHCQWELREKERNEPGKLFEKGGEKAERSELQIFLQKESREIAKRMKEEKKIDSPLEIFEKGINEILEMFHREALDVPYLSTYKREEFRAYDLWEVLRLDKAYSHWIRRLETLKKTIKTLLAEDSPGRKALDRFVETFVSFGGREDDLVDVAMHLRFLSSCRFKGATEKLSEALNTPSFLNLEGENFVEMTSLRDRIGEKEEDADATKTRQNSKKNNTKRSSRRTDFDLNGAEMELIRFIGSSCSLWKKAELLLKGNELGEGVVDEEMTSQLNAEEKTDEIFNALVQKCVEISRNASDSPSVVDSITKFLALEISANPFVRKLCRKLFVEHGQLSTRPTRKGREEIDWTHPLLPARKLNQKPLKSFLEEFREANGEDILEQYALIDEAQRNGFITVQFEFDSPSGERFGYLEEALEGIYEVGAKKSLVEKTRGEVIALALEKHLVPACRQQVHKLLLTKANEFIASQCAEVLREKWLTAGSLDPSGEKIFALSPGGTSEPSFCVVLSPQGELVDYDSFKYLKLSGERKAVEGNNVQMTRKGEELDRLRQLFGEHSPGFIVVGAARGCEEIMKDIEKLISVSNLQTRCELIRPDIAKIFEQSQRSQIEFNEYPIGLRNAVSLGRFALDPLAEISYMASSSELQRNDLLSMRLNEHQKLVPNSILFGRLREAIVQCVNRRGVEINDGSLSLPHKTCKLQFLSGFGPQKAALITRMAKGSPITSRKALLKLLKDFPKTIQNSAGFIRISRSPSETPPLDNTRISPEMWPLTEKVLRFIIERTVSRDIKSPIASDQNINVHKLFQIASEIPNALQGLNSYNKKLLLSQIGGESPETIKGNVKLIERELTSPFKAKEFREFEKMNDEDLFWQLSGESPRTLRPGKEVIATAVTFAKDGAICTLNCSVTGLLPPEKALDTEEGTGSGGDQMTSLKKKLNIGATFRAKIAQLNTEIGRPHVVLDIRKHVLDNEADKDPALVYYPRRLDRHLDLTGSISQEDSEEEHLPKNSTFVPRQIDFPFFRNMSRVEAEEHLGEKDVGSLVVRPSSRGTNYLMATWKLSHAPFLCVHVEISEKNKPNAMSLGRSLAINTMQFEDLDEIYARFFERMTARAKEMMSFRRYRFGSEEELESMTALDKKENPSSVPYNLGVSLKHAGCFVLFYVFSENVKREYIAIVPQGFRFRGKVFKNPEKLVQWFKKNPHENSPFCKKRERVGQNSNSVQNRYASEVEEPFASSQYDYQDRPVEYSGKGHYGPGDQGLQEYQVGGQDRGVGNLGNCGGRSGRGNYGGRSGRGNYGGRRGFDQGRRGGRYHRGGFRPMGSSRRGNVRGGFRGQRW